MAATKPCPVDLGTERCGRPKKRGKNRCEWHWLLGQPIEVQVKHARTRASWAEGLPYRARVKPEEWPPGERWCAGCQSFVPLFYVQGSRCRACNSQAHHGQHIERTYGLSAEEYAQLLEWQGGRCYICRQVPRTKRLAVDHDHVTGAVRGLLCANDEWGCNVSLRRLLADPEAGQRLLEYATMPPLERMRLGHPAKPTPVRKSAIMRNLEDWEPFAS